MRVRIMNAIASADWTYAPGQVVRAGKEFTGDEIPADLAAIWLSTGQAVRVEEVETATAEKREKAARVKVEKR